MAPSTSAAGRDAAPAAPPARVPARARVASALGTRAPPRALWPSCEVQRWPIRQWHHPSLAAGPPRPPPVCRAALSTSTRRASRLAARRHRPPFLRRGLRHGDRGGGQPCAAAVRVRPAAPRNSPAHGSRRVRCAPRVPPRRARDWTRLGARPRRLGFCILADARSSSNLRVSRSYSCNRELRIELPLRRAFVTHTAASPLQAEVWSLRSATRGNSCASGATSSRTSSLWTRQRRRSRPATTTRRR